MFFTKLCSFRGTSHMWNIFISRRCHQYHDIPTYKVCKKFQKVLVKKEELHDPFQKVAFSR